MFLKVYLVFVFLSMGPLTSYSNFQLNWPSWKLRVFPFFMADLIPFCTSTAFSLLGFTPLSLLWGLSYYLQFRFLAMWTASLSEFHGDRRLEFLDILHWWACLSMSILVRLRCIWLLCREESEFYFCFLCSVYFSASTFPLLSPSLLMVMASNMPSCLCSPISQSVSNFNSKIQTSYPEFIWRNFKLYPVLIVPTVVCDAYCICF